jgi:hypothetical protein
MPELDSSASPGTGDKGGSTQSSDKKPGVRGRGKSEVASIRTLFGSIDPRYADLRCIPVNKRKGVLVGTGPEDADLFQTSVQMPSDIAVRIDRYREILRHRFSLGKLPNRGLTAGYLLVSGQARVDRVGDVLDLPLDKDADKFVNHAVWAPVGPDSAWERITGSVNARGSALWVRIPTLINYAIEFDPNLEADALKLTSKGH